MKLISITGAEIKTRESHLLFVSVIKHVGLGGDRSVVSALLTPCTSHTPVDIQLYGCEEMGRAEREEARLGVIIIHPVSFKKWSVNKQIIR